MRLAETVTFGGSDLDRAAHLRGQAGRMADLLETGRVLPVWRGKPFFLTISHRLESELRPAGIAAYIGGAAYEDVRTYQVDATSSTTTEGTTSVQ